MNFRIGDKVSIKLNDSTVIGYVTGITEGNSTRVSFVYEGLTHDIFWWNKDITLIYDKQDMFTYTENTNNLPTSFYSEWVRGLK